MANPGGVRNENSSKPVGSSPDALFLADIPRSGLYALHSTVLQKSHRAFLPLSTGTARRLLNPFLGCVPINHPGFAW